MFSEQGKNLNGEQAQHKADTDERTGQPIEEAEDNLSRHSNADSNPAIEEQSRTNVYGDAGKDELNTE